MTKSQLKITARKLLKDTEVSDLARINASGVRNIGDINDCIIDIADELGIENSYDLAWEIVNNYKPERQADPVKTKRLMALLT